MESTAFDEMLDVARRIGISVRHVRLGGNGGGLAQFKNKRQLFIDQDAAAMDQLEQTARALSKLDELQTIFIRPDVRKLIDECSGGDAKAPPTHADHT